MQTWTYGALVASLLFAASCRPEPRPDVKVADVANVRSLPSNIVTLEVDQDAPGSAPTHVPAHGRLGTGDRYVLRINSSAAVHLYTQRLGANGATTDVMTTSAAPKQQAHLPDAGGWFTLSGPTGEDLIFLVASVNPLAPEAVAQAIDGEPAFYAAQQTLCPQLFSKECRAGQKDPPPGSGKDGRGPCDKVAVCLDADGLAVLRFPIAHK